MESSSSGSSKRARAPSNVIQVPSCLVDGCIADLSECRDYHRRHKVCELHSKNPKVTIRGQEQRFCQQCSRFHSLVEFDEGKRSCRKRLDGHNRRRRKPQPDSLPINSGRFLSDSQGIKCLPFSSPQIFSRSAMNSSWAGAVKAETDAINLNRQSQLNFSDGKTLFLGSSSHEYKGEKQFPFLQGTTSSLLAGTCVSQPLFSANSSSGNSGGSLKMFSDGLNSVIESNCALSLLSSQSAATEEIGMSHLVQPDVPIPSVRSLITSLPYNNGPGMECEPVGSVLVSGGSTSNTNLHGQDLFRIAPDASSASGPHQTVSFSWE